PNPSEQLAIDNFVMLDRYFIAAKHYDGKLPVDDKSWTTWPPSLQVRVSEWLERKRLLPQPYLAGIILQSAQLHFRPSFLLGEYGTSGWWYYFPVAVLVKTPVAELCIAFFVLMVGLWRFKSISWDENYWALSCLLVPAGVYMLMAVFNTVQIGVRHILPVYAP